MEESFKATEGLLARRKGAARTALGNGCIHSSLDSCGDTGDLAAQAAMYLDAKLKYDHAPRQKLIEEQTATLVESLNLLQVLKSPHPRSLLYFDLFLFCFCFCFFV